MIVITSSRWC
ncbi:hypothetical protein Pint_11087 [Pistacia integerrima]|uniref:Uncharacterized protein n=1 Tax=Pistacia integerrima TaxID=434235 RepID=A0ACC0XJ77_9ROSI|nr:hypothetical protein Pint_11087 [Pistacia integerrima]